MRKHVFFIGTMLLLAAAPPAEAQTQSVLISEIAWMGTAAETTGANDEWLELYNGGTGSVGLDGWTLSATDGTPSIALTGTITPGSFFLLERTDDESVPGVAADQFFSGALGNSGEHLVLKDAVGSVVDEINASNGWPAGDNTTKQTMERTGFDQNWATSINPGGTPKAQSSTWQSQPQPPPQSDPNPNEQPQESPPPPQDDPQPYEPLQPNQPPFAAISLSPNTALVGEKVIFDGSDSFDPDGDTLSFGWDFGDGSQGAGQTVSHVFLGPGTFLVRLVVNDGTYQSSTEQTIEVAQPVYSDQVIVSEVLPDPFGSDAEGEFIELHNQGSEPVDLSLWKLDDSADGSRPWTIPRETAISGSSYLVFWRTLTNIAFNNSADMARLLAPDGQKKSALAWETAKEGQALAVIEDKEVWTPIPTPGAQNQIPEAPPEQEQQIETGPQSDAPQPDGSPIVQRDDGQPVPTEISSTSPSAEDAADNNEERTLIQTQEEKKEDLRAQSALPARNIWFMSGVVLAILAVIGVFLLRKFMRRNTDVLE